MCEDNDLLISTAAVDSTVNKIRMRGHEIQELDSGLRTQEWLRRLFLAWMSEAMSNGDFGMSNSRVRG
jgi:uncharacterized protein (DUF2336 family)